MGGTGAATVGLFYPRHFAWISAHIGQTIARNHRPRRLDQLQGWYGPVGPIGEASEGALWDALDLTRVLRDDPAARESFLFLRHGKDDTIIHFGAVVQPSPLTGLSFYDALSRRGPLRRLGRERPRDGRTLRAVVAQRLAPDDGRHHASLLTRIPGFRRNA